MSPTFNLTKVFIWSDPIYINICLSYIFFFATVYLIFLKMKCHDKDKRLLYYDCECYKTIVLWSFQRFAPAASEINNVLYVTGGYDGREYLRLD